MAEKSKGQERKEEPKVEKESKVIKFSLAGKRITVRLVGELELKKKTNPEIIDRLSVVPGRLAYWGAQKANVNAQLDKVKVEEELWMASQYFTVRDQMKDGAKLPTETAIKNRIVLDEHVAYTDFRVRSRELTETIAILNSILKGYEQQVWALRSIVTLRQAELTSMADSGDLSEV